MPNTLLLDFSAPSQDNVTSAQNEFSSLRYQLKKVESKRQCDHAKIQRLIITQSQTILILEREKTEMVKNLHLLQEQGLVVQDKKCSVHLKNLLEKQASYCTEIEDAERIINELTNKIATAKRRLLQMRKVMDVSKDEDKAQRFQMKVEFLESRLNKAVCRYDELRQKNSTYREHINDMLWSRAKFFQIYSDIKHLITVQKQNIKEVISSATAAYNVRDEAKHRIHILKERTELDYQKLNEEMKSLSRVVARDRNLCDFLKHRNKERLSFARKKMEKSPLKDIEELVQKVKTFRDIFEGVAEVAGTSDVNSIIEIYHKAEEENFAKFTLANELNSEVEKVHEAVKILHLEIRNIQSVCQDVKEKGRKSEEDFKSVLERLNSDVADLEKDASFNSDTLQQMKDFVKKLYDRTKIFNGPEGKYVGGSAGVENHNLLEYIEVLELRIVNLLNCYIFLKDTKLKEESKDETPTARQRSTSTVASDLLSRLRDSFESAPSHKETEPYKRPENPEITKVFLDSNELRELATASLQKYHKGK